MTSHTTGKDAEDLARQFLNHQGLTFIMSNYRCRGGEIDLVMQDKEILVFVEVRYRRGSGFGDALESVNHAKQRRLIHAAEHYLQRHHLSSPCRFDVVGLSNDKDPIWVTDAFGT